MRPRMCIHFLQAVFYSSAVINLVIKTLEYFMFELLYSGGWIFYLAEILYIYTFDWCIRQGSCCSFKEKERVDWENPQVFGRNRRRMHTRLRSFPSHHAALEYWKKGGGDANNDMLSNIYLLTGRAGTPDGSPPWNFSMFSSPSSLPPDWEKASLTGIDFSTVYLPGHWQFQGFDVPIYTNTSYPFQFNPPYVERNGTWKVTECDANLGGTAVNKGSLAPTEPGLNATALYRREFSIPHSWHQYLPTSRIFLVFEGVSASVEVWVNEVFVGYSQDSCLPCEFDITTLIRQSDYAHHIAIRVTKWCDGSYLEDQDMWWLSGIYREVYLIRKPETMISDFEIRSNIIWNRDNEPEYADLIVEILTESLTMTERILRVELYDLDTINQTTSLVLSEIATTSREGQFVNASEANSAVDLPDEVFDFPKEQRVSLVSLTIPKERLKLWNPEAPKLFLIIISLHHSNEDAERNVYPLDIEAHRFGFREVVVDCTTGQLLFNRKPLRVAGVNRHEFHCNAGRAIDEMTMLEDAITMKRFNFNAVRCSHYPTHPRWLEICDTVGLVVVDEANIETHGFQTLGQAVCYLASQKDWAGSFFSRITRMYERDKNSTCVIIWSLGNESGVGTSHKVAYKWLKLRDPHRCIQYESGKGQSSVTDIICPMYLRPEMCKKISRRNDKRPLILCEYAHCMGNSAGGLDEYWSLFDDPDYPAVQGGFIWDFIDQGISLKDVEGNIVGFRYGGDFGDEPNTKQFCCNGLFGSNRQPHPVAFEAKHLLSPIAFEELYIKPGLMDNIAFENIFIRIRNRRCFLDTSDICFNISLCCDAPSFRDPKSTSMRLNILPLSEISINLGTVFIEHSCGFHRENPLLSSLSTALNLNVDELSLATEIWIDISATVASDHGSPYGMQYNDEIVHKSFKCSHFSKLIENLRSFKLLQNLRRSNVVKPSQEVCFVNGKQASDNSVSIEWGDGSLAKVSSTGHLISWIDNRGENIISSPVDICLFRAPTDNDQGGGIISYASRWQIAGYDSLSCGQDSDVSIVISSENPAISSANIDVLVRCELRPRPNAVMRYSIPLEIKYSFQPDGAILVSLKLSPLGKLPPLPRFGLRLAVPEGTTDVEWFGLGPHEAYSDRKTCVRLGTFRSDVSDLHVPYIVPQENGRRAEPRWVFLSDSCKEHGLMLIPLSPALREQNVCNSWKSHESEEFSGWGWSASKFSLETLTSCTHDHLLRDDLNKQIHIHIDRFTMGLGGYDSWTPNVSSRYLSTSQELLLMDVLIFPIHRMEKSSTVFTTHQPSPQAQYSNFRQGNERGPM